MTIDIVGAIAGRTARRFLRSPQAIVMTTIFPLLLLLMLLATFSGVVGDRDGLPYVARLAPLVVLATITFGAALTGIGFANDRSDGFFDRVRTLPVSSGVVVVGRLAGDMVRVLLVAVVTIAVSYTVGFRFSQGPLAALAFIGVVLLVGVMFTVLAAYVGLRLDAAGVQSALNLPTILVFFLSSGFVPTEAFPGFLQPVVMANPLSLADDALVGLSAGGPVLVPFLWLLCWVVGVTALCGALAIRQFRSMTAE